ncbi:UNVERIFIED_CONTAM: hypothetical protein HDU68_011342, partial [Siphonaria sp. JEL0065]
MESSLAIAANAATGYASAKAGGKRYMCKTPGCGKDFSTSGHLSRHSRIHYGVKRYSCDVDGCDRTFFRADNALQHQKSHRKRLVMEVSMAQNAPGISSATVLSVPASPQESRSYPSSISKSIMSSPIVRYPAQKCETSFSSTVFLAPFPVHQYMSSYASPPASHESPASPDFSGRVHELCEDDNLTQHRKSHRDYEEPSAGIPALALPAETLTPPPYLPSSSLVSSWPSRYTSVELPSQLYPMEMRIQDDFASKQRPTMLDFSGSPQSHLHQHPNIVQNEHSPQQQQQQLHPPPQQ